MEKKSALGTCGLYSTILVEISLKTYFVSVKVTNEYTTQILSLIIER